jgi:hypothetical protein
MQTTLCVALTAPRCCCRPITNRCLLEHGGTSEGREGNGCIALCALPALSCFATGLAAAIIHRRILERGGTSGGRNGSARIELSALPTCLMLLYMCYLCCHMQAFIRARDKRGPQRQSLQYLICIARVFMLLLCHTQAAAGAWGNK